MAKILILSLVFPPDGVSTAILYGALAEELRALGNDICVLTATPHYNEDIEARQGQPLRPCMSGLYYRSNYKGIPVYHAPVATKGERIGKRLLDYAFFHFVTTLIGIIEVNKYDIILTPSPPLTSGISAWLMGSIRKKSYIYNVQEIFPDIAVKLGVLRNHKLIRFLGHMEGFIYRKSGKVVVISEWFRRRLIAKGVPERKMTVIPNFTDTDFIRPGSRQNHFSDRYGLDEKFVILYAGNIGLTQNFENILEAANRLLKFQQIQFVIVGDGSRKGWLLEKIKRETHSNILFLPYQPRSVVPDMYAASDVCLVPLKGGTAQETFPSKIYTVMAAGRAALVASDEDSELTWLVNKAECGWTVPPDSEEALAKAIAYAYENRKETTEKGGNGRRYVVKHHSRRAVAEKYDSLIRQIVSESKCL